MQYSILKSGDRLRLAVARNGELEFVTTFGTDMDKDQAKSIASGLTAIAQYVPYSATQLLWDAYGEDYVSPNEHDRVHPFEHDHDWVTMDAQKDVREWNRGVVSTYASGTVSGNASGYMTGAGLTALLPALPASARRAVLDEIAAIWKPYTGVLVIARVFDRKWADHDSSICVNAALERLTDAQLDQLEKDPYNAHELLNIIERDDLGDLSDFDDLAESGYLAVHVNLGQLQAWRRFAQR